MTQAARNIHSKSKKSVSRRAALTGAAALRAKSITKRSPKTAPPCRPRIDVTTLPDVYALRTVGNCMAPLVPDGAEAVFSKSEPFQVGDLVAIWHRGNGKLPTGAVQCSVKRLALAPPKGLKFPFNAHPKSEVHPLVFVESIHPVERRFALDCRNIDAIHKFVRVQGVHLQAQP